jgi:hypothetical protein
LNAAVAAVSNPRLGRSALRLAKTPIPASLIAEVPFINSAERVTLEIRLEIHGDFANAPAFSLNGAHPDRSQLTCGISFLVQS